MVEAPWTDLVIVHVGVGEDGEIHRGITLPKQMPAASMQIMTKNTGSILVHSHIWFIRVWSEGSEELDHGETAGPFGAGG
jgi:hypothetical protein